MKSPAVPNSSPLDGNEDGNDLLRLTELQAMAKEPAAPEAEGELAGLQSWDEPIDERGHRVGGGAADDDPTLGEDLVQQGVDEADTEARKRARGIPDAP